jgi:hypothetical protein
MPTAHTNRENVLKKPNCGSTPAALGMLQIAAVPQVQPSQTTPSY